MLAVFKVLIRFLFALRVVGPLSSAFSSFGVWVALSAVPLRVKLKVMCIDCMNYSVFSVYGLLFAAGMECGGHLLESQLLASPCFR